MGNNSYYVLFVLLTWDSKKRICWPFRGDQPCNAINLTMNLNVAYELFEVRNGMLGLSPLKRLGDKAPSGDVESVHQEMSDVIKKAKGADGLEKRRNALRIKSELIKAWNKNGDCTMQLEDMLDSIKVRN